MTTSKNNSLDLSKLEEHNNLMRVHDVSAYTTLGASTIDKYVNLGKFPKPRKLLGKIKVWKREDIVVWLNSQLGM